MPTETELLESLQRNFYTDKPYSMFNSFMNWNELQSLERVLCRETENTCPIDTINQQIGAAIFPPKRNSYID